MLLSTHPTSEAYLCSVTAVIDAWDNAYITLMETVWVWLNMLQIYRYNLLIDITEFKKHNSLFRKFEMFKTRIPHFTSSSQRFSSQCEFFSALIKLIPTNSVSNEFYDVTDPLDCFYYTPDYGVSFYRNSFYKRIWHFLRDPIIQSKNIILSELNVVIVFL